MERDSVNLFKQRVLDYNRVRYADDVNWSIAFNSLNVDDIKVLEYVPDPENPAIFVVTKIASDKFSLNGIDQKYTKATFDSDVISKPSDTTVYPDLLTISNLAMTGMFYYESEGPESYPLVAITGGLLYSEEDGVLLLQEIVKQINQNTYYDIKLSDCTITKDNSIPEVEMYDVLINGNIIFGLIKFMKIDVIYPMGTYPYEYLGKFGEHYLVEKDTLLATANIFDGEFDQYRPDTALVWLKFRYFGKIVYIPKMPILSDVSWDILNQAKMTMGQTVIMGNDGNEYRLRLLNVDPEYGEDEFKNLLYRCVRENTMGEQWEVFDYSTEMTYGYPNSRSVAPVTEGVDIISQRYFAGVNRLETEELILPVTTNQTYVLSTDRKLGNHGAWLPVLELRGVDPINTNTARAEWADIVPVVPNSPHFTSLPNPKDVFPIKLLGAIVNADIDEPELIIPRESSALEIKPLALKTMKSPADIDEPVISLEDGTSENIIRPIAFGGVISASLISSPKNYTKVGGSTSADILKLVRVKDSSLIKPPTNTTSITL